jgi:hypothetical protein
MFLAVGLAKRRMHMSMASVYSADHMYDRAAPHLYGMQAVGALVTQNGTIQSLPMHTGVYLEWQAGEYEKLRDEGELRLASRLVTSYHDSLRIESEQLSIREQEWVEQETALMEEVTRLRFEQWEEEGTTSSSDCDDYDHDDEF